jgi:hypothetical protein
MPGLNIHSRPIIKTSREIILNAKETIRRSRETLRLSREVKADRERSAISRGLALDQAPDLALRSER